MSNSIPFNRPVVAGRELEYLGQAIERGQLAGDGLFTEKCEAILTEVTQAASSHLTHSCTAALEMAAILCDLKPGDEVIMPSYTFVSTANAVVLRGAVPVFVDIDPVTLNLDPDAILEAVTDRTRAIYAVHYAGVVADMERIAEIAARHDLYVVEDAAQALGAERNGRPAGSFGDYAAFSFHETKNIISGEGGALVVKDAKNSLRAEIIREKGTNRAQFFRGAVDKYSWVDVGSSFLPGELVAAFLLGQLERWRELNATRMQAWDAYHQAFEGVEDHGIARPRIPENCRHNAHMYYLIMPDVDARSAFIDHMRGAGIMTPFHYVPLHSAPYGRSHSRAVGDMATTNRISECLVRLPLFPGVLADVPRIAETANKAISELGQG
ncbi:dTDP-4-amino-4,6-dideoxygalactose transaminase [Maricaulis sp. CAU 1757]